MSLPITIKTILQALDRQAIKAGFANLSSDDIDSIFLLTEPFVISKAEWEKALTWEMDLPKRSRVEWWEDFIQFGYLQPILDSKDNKKNEAWFRIDNVIDDIISHKGSLEQFLGDDS